MYFCETNPNCSVYISCVDFLWIGTYGENAQKLIRVRFPGFACYSHPYIYVSLKQASQPGRDSLPRGLTGRGRSISLA
jgi:hypothetical protein